MNQLSRLSGLVALLLAVPVLADEVTYRETPGKKPVKIEGTIVGETPAGLKIKGKAKGAVSKLLQPSAILRVYYDDLLADKIDRLTYGEPFGFEERGLAQENTKKRAADLDKALTKYRELSEKVLSSSRAKRYLQYKIANLLALQARDDPRKVDVAIKALSDYRTKYPTSWPIVPVLETLGKMQEDAGQADEARKTFEELGELPDTPAPIKQRSDLLVARLYLRGKQFEKAEKRLEGLNKSLAPADPQRSFVLAYLAESQLGQGKLSNAKGMLEQAMKTNSEPRFRAVAYNLLGDYYLKQNRPEEAFWQYLRVDVLYPDDREEHARSLYNLGILFEKLKNDRNRAARCWEELKEARFAGTTYQRLAAEKKK